MLRPGSILTAVSSGSHLDVEGSALGRSSSDSVSVESSIEESLVEVVGSPNLVSALLSNASFVRGSSYASVAGVVKSGPRDLRSDVGGQVNVGASSLKFDGAGVTGRRLSPVSSSGSRDRSDLNLHFLARKKVVIVVEGVERDFTGLDA